MKMKVLMAFGLLSGAVLGTTLVHLLPQAQTAYAMDPPREVFVNLTGFCDILHLFIKKEHRADGQMEGCETGKLKGKKKDGIWTIVWDINGNKKAKGTIELFSDHTFKFYFGKGKKKQLAAQGTWTGGPLKTDSSGPPLLDAAN